MSDKSRFKIGKKSSKVYTVPSTLPKRILTMTFFSGYMLLTLTPYITVKAREKKLYLNLESFVARVFPDFCQLLAERTREPLAPACILPPSPTSLKEGDHLYHIYLTSGYISKQNEIITLKRYNIIYNGQDIETKKIWERDR